MTKMLSTLPGDMQRVGREDCATPEMPHLLKVTLHTGLRVLYRIVDNPAGHASLTS